MRSSIKRTAKMVGWTVVGCLLAAGIVLWTQGKPEETGMKDWLGSYEELALKRALKAEVSQLPPVDEVEVYRLSDEPAFGGQRPLHQGYIDKRPLYEAKKVTLKGADASAFADLWRLQIVERNVVTCHNPHHALRFLNHGMQVSQAIVCFDCANAEIPSTVFRGELISFESGHPQYFGLRKRMEELVGAAP